MLIGRMTSDNRTACANANGDPNITTTAYTRTMAACQVLQEMGLSYNTDITTQNFYITNDVAYYTAMSRAFLASYGLLHLFNSTDWTQNFPLVSILHAYLEMAAMTPVSAQDPTTFECNTGTYSFTNVSDFYTEFIGSGCPTLGFDLTGQLYCLTDSNCECESNNYGITPYSARPSFRGMSDAAIAQVLSTTCYYWDNGLAYPSVPQELVLGRPEPTDAVESSATYTHVNGYEFVLYVCVSMARFDHVFFFFFFLLLSQLPNPSHDSI